MLRPTAAALSALSSAQHTTIPSLLSRSYSKSSNPVPEVDRHVSATKRWLAAQENRRETIPRNTMSVKYSAGATKERCGSANTKVTLQLPVHALSKEIPPEMVEGVQNLKSYVRSTNVLEISSDQSRRQRENLEICYRKLDDSLRQVAIDGVAKEAARDKVTRSRKDQIADISDSEWRKMGAMQRKAHIQRRSRDKKKEKEAASREEKARLEKGRDRSQARSPR